MLCAWKKKEKKNAHTHTQTPQVEIVSFEGMHTSQYNLHSMSSWNVDICIQNNWPDLSSSKDIFITTIGSWLSHRMWRKTIFIRFSLHSVLAMRHINCHFQNYRTHRKVTARTSRYKTNKQKKTMQNAIRNKHKRKEIYTHFAWIGHCVPGFLFWLCFLVVFASLIDLSILQMFAYGPCCKTTSIRLKSRALYWRRGRCQLLLDITH